MMDSCVHPFSPRHLRFIPPFARQPIRPRGGQNWSAPRNVSRNPGESATPSVALDSNGKLHIVWRDKSYSPPRLLYCRWYNDACELLYVLSPSNGDVQYPKIVASGTNLYLVWVDNSTGYNQVFYRSSTDSGSTWSGTTNVSNDQGDTLNPAVAIAPNGTVHIVCGGTATPGVVDGQQGGQGGSGYKLYYRSLFHPTRVDRPHFGL